MLFGRRSTALFANRMVDSARYSALRGNTVDLVQSHGSSVLAGRGWSESTATAINTRYFPVRPKIKMMTAAMNNNVPQVNPLLQPLFKYRNTCLPLQGLRTVLRTVLKMCRL